MFAKTLLLGLLGAAVAAAQAGASPAEPIHLTGHFRLAHVTPPACTKTASQPWVLHCKAGGYVIEYTGALQGSSTSTFNETLDCKKGLGWGGGTETVTGLLAGLGP